MPGFHEVRALSLHLYKKAGKDGQKIAGHTSEGMIKNYQRDHDEIIWSEAIPDLNISHAKVTHMKKANAVNIGLSH